MLKNAYLRAKIGFDTAANELSKSLPALRVESVARLRRGRPGLGPRRRAGPSRRVLPSSPGRRRFSTTGYQFVIARKHTMCIYKNKESNGWRALPGERTRRCWPGRICWGSWRSPRRRRRRGRTRRHPPSQEDFVFYMNRKYKIKYWH